jgi:hypothetical protein
MKFSNHTEEIILVNALKCGSYTHVVKDELPGIPSRPQLRSLRAWDKAE